jgi:hypothetical protein
MNVHSLAFLFAPRCNTLQKAMCYYFRAKHVPKALFQYFNKCGHVMSYSWSLGAIHDLSDSAVQQMRDAVEKHAVFWIYDNLRLPNPIKSQRGDRHTVTDNGTAMTVVEIPDEVKHIFFAPTGDTGSPGSTDDPAPLILPVCKFISWDDFVDFERLERLAIYDHHSIISILFETIPGLGTDELTTKFASILTPPVPRCAMPTGKDHKTRYYMLGTVPIDESSIGGNVQVFAEMLSQQGLDSEANQKLLGAKKRIFPTVGDQMTNARIDTVLDLRIRDPNGFERMEYCVPVPGWFHIVLNLGMSTFDCFRGGDLTMSFIRDVTLLGRTGLTMNMRKKRPDFHTNDEFLRHKLYALIRSLWMHYSDTQTVDELAAWVRSISPAQLHQTAVRIYAERISAGAIESLSNEPELDQVLRNIILMTRDLLQYHSVRTAIQSGNVGWLEDLLPNLLIYFKGRGNSNYAVELVNTLQ